MSVNACTHTRHRHGDRTSFRRCTLFERATKICFPFRARKRLTERRARNPGGKQRRNEFVYLRFSARLGTRKQKENRKGKKKMWRKIHDGENIGKLSLKFRDRNKSSRTKF